MGSYLEQLEPGHYLLTDENQNQFTIKFNEHIYHSSVQCSSGWQVYRQDGDKPYIWFLTLQEARKYVDSGAASARTPDELYY